jgi:hypothetical protein
MAATAQPTRAPLGSYLRSSYEPNGEFVNGVIEARPMGEYDHSSWQHAIEPWFSQRAQEWGIRARPDLRDRVSGSACRFDLAQVEKLLD